MGKDDKKLEEALKRCRKHLGDGAVTILHDHWIPDSMKTMVREQSKEGDGAWECYDAKDFYGWETDRVVVVTEGTNIMELISRARTKGVTYVISQTNIFSLNDNFVPTKTIPFLPSSHTRGKLHCGLCVVEFLW